MCSQDNWITPKRIFSPLKKTFLNSIQLKKSLKKVDYAYDWPCYFCSKRISHCKDSVDRKFGMHLKALFTLADPALQPALSGISVCQTSTDWTRTIYNQHDPVFQDHAVADQLQQLPSALLCRSPGTWHEANIQDDSSSLIQSSERKMLGRVYSGCLWVYKSTWVDYIYIHRCLIHLSCGGHIDNHDRHLRNTLAPFGRTFICFWSSLTRNIRTGHIISHALSGFWERSP